MVVIGKVSSLCVTRCHGNSAPLKHAANMFKANQHKCLWKRHDTGCTGNDSQRATTSMTLLREARNREAILPSLRDVIRLQLTLILVVVKR